MAIGHAFDETTKIVALLPNAGSQDIDSDVEDLPEGLNENTVNICSIFEPAGQVEVIDVNENNFAPVSSVEVAPPKRRKTSTKLWKKSTTFDKDIPAKPLGSFSDTYQYILVHSPYKLWRLFATDDLLSTIVEQTNLCKNRDKNDQSFATSQPENFRVFEILLRSGYHSLPSEADYWSNQVDLGVSAIADALSSKRFKKI